MAITDYDKKKKLETSDFNDANTTQDKAQPVIMAGNYYTGVDGFESGSSQLNWEGNSGFTIDANAEVYGNDSLQINSANAMVSAVETLNSTISSDGKRVTKSVKIDNQTTNSSDFYEFLIRNSGSVIAQIRFAGDGDIRATNSGSFSNIDTWSTNSTDDIEVVLDFTNETYDVVVNDTTVALGFGFSTSQSQADEIRLINDTTGSGSTVNTFVDRLTYTNASEDSINAGGWIGYDSSIVADAQDVGWYDGNGNLRSYEIENEGDVGSSTNKFVMWGYGSRTRDNTVQDQIAYGNNSANTDRQNVTGTWNNTGQNAVMVQHFNDDPLTATDSTSNNNDGTVNGAVSTTGEFDGAASFDGVDDDVTVPDNPSFDSSGNDQTWAFWLKWNGDNSNNDARQVITSKFNDGSSGEWFIVIEGSASDNPKGTVSADIPFVEGDVVISNSTIPDDGTETQIVVTKTSGGSWELFLNGSSDATNSTSNKMTNTNSDVEIGESTAGADSNNFNGVIDDAQFHIGSTWTAEHVQAEYDASPKAGQVFFTQQAAETTTTGQTISTPETVNTSTTPSPSVNPGVSTVQTTTTVNTSTTPAPALNATATVNVSETALASSNPDPTITEGQTIVTSETVNTSFTPAPAVNAGTATVTVPETTLTSTTVEAALNRQILIGTETQLTSSTLEPSVDVGTATVTVSETANTATTPDLVLQPREATTQVTPPTTLTQTTPALNATGGVVTLSVDESVNTVSTAKVNVTLSAVDVKPPLEFVDDSMDKYFNDETG